jgi:hypothetical protein
VLFVHEDAGNAGQVVKSPDVNSAYAIDNLDSVGAGVGNIEPAPGAINVGVVKTGLCSLRQVYEAGADERHPAATSFLHHA